MSSFPALSVQRTICSPNDSIARAARIMRELDLNSLLVTDFSGYAVGVLRTEDIRRGQLSTVSDQTVSAVMRGVAPSAPLR